MSLYDIFEIVLGVLIGVLGVYMYTNPERATKEANRDKPEAVAKIKKSGLILIILGVLLTILMIIAKLV